MSINRVLLAIPAALLLAACGGGDGATGPNENPGPGQNGTFSGTIAGGLSKSVTGEAVFGTSAAEGGFALMLGDDNDGFVFGREVAGIPGTGTYEMWDLTDDETEEEEMPETAISGVFGLTNGGTSHLCYTTGGTITITTSTSTRLAGNLNVTATCYNAASGAPTNITLTGQFNGVGGQVD